MFSRVERLTDDHVRAKFDCGTPTLTGWFREQARQSQAKHTAVVYVSRFLDDDGVAGYYALATGSVAPIEAPPRIRKGAGRHQPVPVILLARLAVDVRAQGHGLGRALLVDAFRRVVAAAGEIGCRALLIHCEDERARAFYLRHAAFEQSPVDPLQLMLHIDDLRAALA